MTITQEEYSSPEVGTITLLESKHAKDITGDLVNSISSLLETKGLTQRNTIMPIQDDQLIVHIKDYLNRFPERIHGRHWIDTGKGLAVVHPLILIPFFLNETGSKICRLSDGKHSIQDVLTTFKKKWSFIPHEVIETDFLKFLLLVEELDLIKL